MNELLLPQNYKDYLVREFNSRKSRRPAYSKRAFARDLGLSPSTLVDFLKGKPCISSRRILELSEKLRLNAKSRDHWLDLYTIAFSKKASEVKLAKARILERSSSLEDKKSLEQFNVACEPIYWIYLELLTINPQMQSLSKAAIALGITEAKLKKINKELLNLGFLKKSPEGILTPSEAFRIFGDGRPSKTLRHFHKSLMKKAINSLETQSSEDRFQASVIFSIPKNKLKDLIYKLEKVNYEVLTEFSEGSDQDSVYGFSFHLFDLIHKPPQQVNHA